MPMNHRILRPLARPLLLDAVPGAAAAYSLRQLSNAYTGPVVTVRRSSDDAEEDFKASEIDDGTLAAFCGAGDGFVKTWFDQSGNGRDASQTTAAAQPKIVSSGSLVTEGGMAALQFDGVNDYMDATSVVVSQPDTIFSVSLRVSGNGNHVYDGITSRQVLSVNASLKDSVFAGTPLEATAAVYGRLVLHAVIFNGVSTAAYRDGVITATGNAGSNGLNGLRIGAFTPSAADLDGRISELIIYPSDQTANRERIEGDIAWYY